MDPEFVMRAAMISFDRSVLDYTVHAFNPTICPGRIDLGPPVLDTMIVAHKSNICVLYIGLSGCCDNKADNRARRA